ncbi:hypothetical protein D3C86_1530510 [compost metagenome]
MGGIAQKIDEAEYTPAVARHNITTVTGAPRSGRLSTKKATAAARAGTITCQRRSNMRSELRPTKYITIVAVANGSIIKKPTCLRSVTPALLMIDGPQMLITPEPAQTAQ